MKKFPFTLPLMLAFTSTQAMDMNLFERALQNGTAQAELAPEISAALQQKLGKGDYKLVSWRIQKFKQQPECGRVSFAVLNGKTIYREIGGDLNICMGGVPPWKICGGGQLVPPKDMCSDGTLPADTEEVQLAIKESLKGGGISNEQLLRRLNLSGKK